MAIALVAAGVISCAAVLDLEEVPFSDDVQPLDAGVEAGDAGTELRRCTFENGTAVGALGVDQVNGSALVTQQKPLRGKYSLRIVDDDVRVDFDSRSEVWVSFYFSVGAPQVVATVPLAGTDKLFVELVDTGDPLHKLAVRARVEDLVVGTSAPIILADAGWRLALHLRQPGLTEIWAVSSSDAFGPSLLTYDQTPFVAPFSRLYVGKANAVGSNLVVDDVLVDEASLAP